MMIRWSSEYKKALQVLYKALNTNHRRTASEYLCEVKYRNETERPARERLLLLHLGQESESEAFRVLPTCRDPRTAEALLPILDDQHTPRTVYAALVLAQHPSGPVVEKANRRLAVCRVLCPSNPQQASRIREMLEMSASEFRSLILYSIDTLIPQSPLVKPPEKLFQSLELDEKERAFSIRLYRYLRMQSKAVQAIIVSGARHDAFLWPGTMFTQNKSFLPLLNAIVTEDPHLKALHVKGKKWPISPVAKQPLGLLLKSLAKEPTIQGLTTRGGIVNRFLRYLIRIKIF